MNELASVSAPAIRRKAGLRARLFSDLPTFGLGTWPMRPEMVLIIVLKGESLKGEPEASI
jgi:hypothetical protein